MGPAALALVLTVGLFGAGCAPAPVGALLVSNRSDDTYYLVINTLDGGSAFFRIDPGAEGLAALPDASRPRRAVVLYTAVCDAVLGSSDDSSRGMVIGADGAVSFGGGGLLGVAIPPLPTDARCRW